MYTTTENAAVSKRRTELALNRIQVTKEHRCGGGTGLSVAISAKTVRCSTVRNSKVIKSSYPAEAESGREYMCLLMKKGTRIQLTLR